MTVSQAFHKAKAGEFDQARLWWPRVHSMRWYGRTFR